MATHRPFKLNSLKINSVFVKAMWVFAQTVANIKLAS